MAENWYLSVGEEISGPHHWTEILVRVQNAGVEEIACVRAESSQAWKPFKAALAQVGTAAATTEPDPVAFCQTAIRLGILSPEIAHQVLEQRRAEAAAGTQKQLLLYFRENNLMTAEQIATVMRAVQGGPGANLIFEAGSVNRLAPLPDPLQRKPQGRPLKFSLLFPFKEWVAESPWSSAWVRWFAFYVLFPLLLSQFLSNTTSLGDVTWALGAYFAVLSSMILYFWLRPQVIPFGRLAGIAAFTGTAGVILVLFGQKLPIIAQLYGIADAPNFLMRLFGSVLGIGVVEEGAKLLPIYWIYVHKKKPGDFRQIMFLGAISGLAFGVTEAVQYSYVYARAHSAGLLQSLTTTGDIPQSLYAGYVVAQATRILALPLLHGLFTALSAVFIAFAVRVPQRKVGLILRGWFAAAVLHGVYDASQYQPDPLPWIALASGLAALLIFVLYSHTGEAIAERIASDQSSGATAVPSA